MADSVSVLSNVRVYQVLTQQGNLFPVSPEVHVRFTLTQATDVAMEVGAQRPDDAGGMFFAPPYDYYLPEPTHVQTLKLGRLEAGEHEAVWNGLDEKGAPLIGTNMMGHYQVQSFVTNNKGVLPTAEQLLTHSPINLFRFTVKAGTDQVGVNYRRVVDGVGTYRELDLGDVRSVASDGKGGFVAANNSALQSSHLSPSFQEIGYYPDKNDSTDQRAPSEAHSGVIDGKGHVLIAAGHYLFRYNLEDGKPAPWPKLPNANGEMLDTNVAPSTGTDALSVDAAGNLWLLRRLVNVGNPKWSDGSVVISDVQILDSNGAPLRTLPLPKEVYTIKPGQTTIPTLFAVDKNGDFWAGGSTAYLLDGKTGAIKAQFKQPLRGLALGADGSVYGWDNDGKVFRAHADGAPFPFGSAALGTIDQGSSLSWRGPDSPLFPIDQASYPSSLIGGEKGDFYLVMQPGAHGQPILHFSPDGKYLPEMVPRVDLVPSVPANIFVENEPAVVDFFVNNPNPQDLLLTLDWTLTDFFGKSMKGQSKITIKALSRQSTPVVLPVPEFGFYHLTGAVEGSSITFSTALARIRYHDLKPDPDSHFGMVWNRNFYFGGLLGQKKERTGSYAWQWREPVEGLVLPDVPDLPQVGFTARRKDAARWGLREGELATFGEPYTEGYYINQIHDLNRYLTDWMGVVDFLGGFNIQHYQFWNEPNNYWHQNSGFQWDFYDTVNADFWDINKARDKEARSIPDGNAGNFDILTLMAANDTSAYIDGLPCHYVLPPIDQQQKFPASLGTSEMGSLGLPESASLEMRNLIALRDKSFPGKPVIDTEDGWWGDNTISEKAGADAIPRFFIPDIAVGLDELYWFSMEDIPGVPSSSACPLNASHPPEAVPYPSFCSYATMTQELEGAEYAGTVDLQKGGSQAYLFRKGDQMILAAWAILGEIDVTIPIGDDEVTVFDIMSHKSQIKATGPEGQIPLHLTGSIQYLNFPCNAWAKTIAKQELDKQLADLKVDDVKSIPDEMKMAAATALTDLSAMNRYHHLVKAARQACFADEWPESDNDDHMVESLRAAILSREGKDGYLRQARLPLNWTEQIVRVAAIQSGQLQKSLLSVANAAAQACQPIAASETVVQPGCAVNAFIGDVGEIEKIRAVPFTGPTYPFYEGNFRTQIPKKAGEKFELELNMWNFYRHPIQATMAPQLPDGWTAVASKPPESSTIAPGKFARLLYTVTIPVGAKTGLYPIDGTSTYDGKTQSCVLPQRILIQ